MKNRLLALGLLAALPLLVLFTILKDGAFEFGKVVGEVVSEVPIAVTKLWRCVTTGEPLR